MDILFLSTSGHGVTPARNLPGLLIDGHILIDCGEGTLKSLLEFGVDPMRIDFILLSHLHADHCLGVVALLWNLGIYQENMDLNVPCQSPVIYVPYGMKNHLNQILLNTFSPLARVKYEVRIVELPEKCDDPLHLNSDYGDYSIEWLATNHSPLCYAYKCNGQLVISGDTSPFKEMECFIQEAHVLIHEATFWDENRSMAHKLGHSVPSDVLDLVEYSSISQVFFNHLPALRKDQESNFLKGVMRKKVKFLLAFDGLRFKF